MNEQTGELIRKKLLEKLDDRIETAVETEIAEPLDYLSDPDFIERMLDPELCFGLITNPEVTFDTIKDAFRDLVKMKVQQAVDRSFAPPAG
jgi:hypothetical protein